VFSESENRYRAVSGSWTYSREEGVGLVTARFREHQADSFRAI